MAVDPREVARWVWLWGRSFNNKGPDAGFLPDESSNGVKVWDAHPPSVFADRLARLANLPAAPMTGPALFVELCAGLASVSLRLQGGPGVRPPVSRMGNKAGYADMVLAAMGLEPGQGAQSFLWCEPDDGCRALLQAYPQPDVLRAAAEIIRGWKDEDPRALWERLRAEGPIRGADAGEVARHLYVVGNAAFGGDPWASHGTGGPSVIDMGKTGSRGNRRPLHTDINPPIIDAWPPVTVAADCREIDAPEDCFGVVAFMDPPYVGTTGYGSPFPRHEYLAVARRWHDAGALVCISEATDLRPWLGDGWHAVEITHTRRGQKRTFSAQQSEWLTQNQPFPAHVLTTCRELNRRAALAEDRPGAEQLNLFEAA